MTELLRVVEEPRSCPYLPHERASQEYRIVSGLEAAEYADLLARGFRRFGHQLFRPACRACTQCVSLRVLVNEFAPSRSQRRILKKNRGIRAERLPVFVTRQHLELFDRYHRFMSRNRGWRYEPACRESYIESFVAGGRNFACQWMFWDGAKLVGVSLMDEVPGAVSLVYAYHDPEWRPLGAGTFAILTQLAYAREKGLRYAYPGYWIAANPSMSYKARFRPHERLVRYPADHEKPQWVRAEAGAEAGASPLCSGNAAAAESGGLWVC